MASAWFFAVLTPIVLVIDVSGAHLNPAVTLALASSRRFPWRDVPGYWLAQFGGALCASLLVLATLGNGSHLGATLPANGDLLGAFAAEAVFTGLLVGSVFGIADRRPGGAGWRILLPPAVVGAATYLIGPWTGSSLNPARTVAPAVMSGTYADLWLYLVAVPAGALTAAALWRPREMKGALPGYGTDRPAL